MFRAIMFSLALVVLLGRVFIEPRLAVPTWEGSYEALAHMVVGFLIFVPWYDRRSVTAWKYGVLGWALAVWELVWFVLQKNHA